MLGERTRQSDGGKSGAHIAGSAHNGGPARRVGRGGKLLRQRLDRRERNAERHRGFDHRR